MDARAAAALTAERPATWRVLAGLARASNLPTVWSNALAAVALTASGGGRAPALRIHGLAVLLSAVALSAMYAGGMFLNDAFDRHYDARHRPERPIAARWIGARAVFAGGAALLALGIVVFAWFGRGALAAAVLLAAAIVLYDAWHKGNPLGPLVMGACRGLAFACAALTVGEFGGAAAIAALVNAGYVVALTVLAKRQATGRIGALIAGISLLDALWIAISGAPAWSLLAIGAFFATLRLQRRIAGT
jgi:4-hydroxybenzoate polyprenyltransferase